MVKPEEIVLSTTPMPRGYTFVRKGNVYITAHCRRATHAEGRVVYTVVQDLSQRTILGLRCPRHIVTDVRVAEQASRATRHAATDKRDAALAENFRTALLARYPAVPADNVPRIVQHAMQKHSRRVARTGTLDLDERVQLAVRAHIRHCWTKYETLLRERIDRGHSTVKQRKGKLKTRQSGGRENDKLRAEARALTLDQVNAIERQWTTGSSNHRKEQANDSSRQTLINDPRTSQALVAGCSTELAIVIDGDSDECRGDGDPAAATQ
ncbi:hypothetical protein SEPCBS57363_006381 [Sporothrix epigloea]|uniref:DUF2293 domain-containing protein n=1 Tax=Sporothrix epigloea TaxID=1892477 RepID=A0ABP0E6X0_9PEZI